jgi:hypothetical protein
MWILGLIIFLSLGLSGEMAVERIFDRYSS